ncbi:Acyl-homoserine lactone acylase QuiP [termite gut metagenome]|uniref:Acyl-homoserine lactone acylase QuiP n=1 Tax=termite gut metagenome TaxID=433724 RepID=A0A5J4SJR0_9ZZZZ
MNLLATDEITIDRIQGGIPLIKVSNQKDKYFGLGYCHGIDRGMQLMVMKILGSGTASKNMDASDEMLEIDKFFRRMNWNNNTGDEIHKLNDEQKEYLQSYCDGINRAFEKNKPWELKLLLGFKKFHWSLDDCILLARMSGFLTLAQSQGEIERLFIQLVQKGVDKSLLNELFPNILSDYDESIIEQIKLGDKIVPDEVRWNVANNSFMASNNWAISGNNTISGKPILANDPHLEINRLPAVWYEVAIQLGQNYVHGATMPGLASIIIGRNDKLAWGVTYAFMDAIDSWIEKCKDGKYFKDGLWHNFIERKEIINRKKGDPVSVTYYDNEHGTLDGDPYQEGYYLSSKWSGDRSGAASIISGFLLSDAKEVKEGMKIAGKIESAFSWVFADTEGNIGFQMSGLMPNRNDGKIGFIPLPGWLSENDWQGYHDAESLPNSYNPPEGYIVTANNDLNHLGAVSPINIPMGDYRASRIKELIENSEKHELSDSEKMQYDVYSIHAEKFMEFIRPLLPDTEAGDMLKKWDLCYDTKSKGAFLFEMIFRQLFYEVFGDVLGKSVTEFLNNETGILADFYQNFDNILLAEESKWFRGKTRDQIYQKAMDLALKMEVKEWGEINHITLSHIILGGKLPKFLGFDAGPFPLPGGRATIHQAQTYTSANRKTSFAPSFRLVTDMAEKKLRTNYAGGVSDRRYSKLYKNDFSNWANEIFKEFKF